MTVAVVVGAAVVAVVVAVVVIVVVVEGLFVIKVIGGGRERSLSLRLNGGW